MNEKNLKPIRTESEAREKGRNGGIASGKARREKKTVRKILSEMLETEIKDSPQFTKLAAKIGIESDKSVKDMFTMVCLMNSVKNGNLSDLEKLSGLLGEHEETQNNGILDELAEYMKNDRDVKR